MFLSRGDRDLGVAFQTHPGCPSQGDLKPVSQNNSWCVVNVGAPWEPGPEWVPPATLFKFVPSCIQSHRAIKTWELELHVALESETHVNLGFESYMELELHVALESEVHVSLQPGRKPGSGPQLRLLLL